MRVPVVHLSVAAELLPPVGKASRAGGGGAAAGGGGIAAPVSNPGVRIRSRLRVAAVTPVPVRVCGLRVTTSAAVALLRGA